MTLIICFSLITIFLIYRWIKKAKAYSSYLKEINKNKAAQFYGRDIVPKTSRYSAEHIGADGEEKVSLYLANLPCDNYHVFNDILIQNGEFTTQIDHVVISRYGIFVIETKNMHGNIYGGENSEFWKQYLPDTGFYIDGSTQEFKLRNPIQQNLKHIKVLQHLVFGNTLPIHSIIAFPNDTELYVSSDSYVTTMDEIVPYINSFKEIVLTQEEIGNYEEQLLSIIVTDETARQKHLDNIHNYKKLRDIAVSNKKCPLCGGKLIERKGKYGLFYGCSNYPKCHYILSKQDISS